MKATPSGGLQNNGPGPAVPKGDLPGDEKKKKPSGCWIPCVIAGCGLLLLGIAVLGIAAAIAIPNLERASARANIRACFANQKTIMGAIEMYQLDTNKTPEKIDRQFLETLKNSGYLVTIPKDPGFGDESWSHYKYVASGERKGLVFCTQHGFIQPPGRCTGRSSPLEQATAAGVTDPEILAACSKKSPEHF